VKRHDLIRHPRKHGCRFVREGREDSIRENPANGQRTAVPRHAEVLNFTAARIGKQLGIPAP
jgi:mRNA interferase HicA